MFHSGIAYAIHIDVFIIMPLITSQCVDWTATLVWMWIYEKCMRMGVGMICRQHGSPTSYRQAGTQTAFCSRGKWTIILHFAWEKQCKLHFAWGKQYKLHFARERQHGNEKGFCWATSRLSKSRLWSSFKEGKQRCSTKTDMVTELSNIHV